MHPFSFLCPTKTCFGLNALESLPFDLTCMGCKKPLIIQDSTALDSGAVKTVIRSFKDSGMTLGVSPAIDDAPGEHAKLTFMESACRACVNQGHDGLIALGGDTAAKITAGVRTAVALENESTAAGRNPGRLSALILIPQTPASGLAFYGGMPGSAKSRLSDFPAPDQVVIVPELLICEDWEPMIDTALFCLALGCEICALSGNAAACAYARLVVFYAGNVLAQIPACSRNNGKASPELQKDLVQAAVMAGCLGSIPCTLTCLGRTIESLTCIPMGRAMCMMLPGLLETAAALEPKPCAPVDPDTLLLALSGPEAFSRVPKPRRLSAAIQTIGRILAGVHSIDPGKYPATPAGAGVDQKTLSAAARQICESGTLSGMTPSRLQTLFTHALNAHPPADR